MDKDVIYIDIDDDITAVIGKIKNSKGKIVALVPPKRVGILQSAVNLRLLSRAAKGGKKHLVLITNDKALVNLSATAKIPVAKNLQSKPEIAQIAAIEVDDEDIIDGAKLPVGDLAERTVAQKHIVKVKDMSVDANGEDNSSEESGSESDDVITDIKIEDKDKTSDEDEGDSKDKPGDKKKKIKVPDFSIFRKRFFIGGVAGVALISFLVWALAFAPAAKVIITAKTDPAPVSLAVKLGGAVATDTSKGIIQAISKQIKKDASVDFEATGQKETGEKASGKITIQNCDSSDEVTIDSGTVFVADSGERFISNATASIPGYTSGSGSLCRLSPGHTGAGTGDVSVVAESAGTAFNIDATSYSIANDTRDLYAAGGAMAGGTSKIIKVVTSDDVFKASQALADLPTDSAKAQLVKQFTNGEFEILDSFEVKFADPVSTPAVGAELATGKAKLVSQGTYTMTAIARSELETYLKYAITKQLDDNQKIYSDGVDSVVLSGYLFNETASTINVAATGQIGPSIDEKSVKNMVKGKKFGDVQSSLQSIKGVSDVQVKFSYFWVNTIPNDLSKIQVETKFQDD